MVGNEAQMFITDVFISFFPLFFFHSSNRVRHQGPRLQVFERPACVTKRQQSHAHQTVGSLPSPRIVPLFRCVETCGKVTPPRPAGATCRGAHEGRGQARLRRVTLPPPPPRETQTGLNFWETELGVCSGFPSAGEEGVKAGGRRGAVSQGSASPSSC